MTETVKTRKPWILVIDDEEKIINNGLPLLQGALANLAANGTETGDLQIECILNTGSVTDGVHPVITRLIQAREECQRGVPNAWPVAIVTDVNMPSIGISGKPLQGDLLQDIPNAIKSSPGGIQLLFVGNNLGIPVILQTSGSDTRELIELAKYFLQYFMRSGEYPAEIAGTFNKITMEPDKIAGALAAIMQNSQGTAAQKCT